MNQNIGEQQKKVGQKSSLCNKKSSLFDKSSNECLSGHLAMPVEYMRVPIIGLGVPVPLVAIMWVVLVIYVTLVMMAQSHEVGTMCALHRFDGD